jgi:hypothetical protein
MTDSTSEAPIDERPADALRLLFRAEIAWMCWILLSEHLEGLYPSFLVGSDRRLPAGIATVLWLPLPVLSGVLAFGLVRFVAPQGDVWARRWGYTAALLFGVRAAWHLCLGLLPLAGVERDPLGTSIFLVNGLLAAGNMTAMLLAVWRGSQALTASPPTGVLRFAAGAVALQWVFHLVRYAHLPSFDPGGSQFRGFGIYGSVHMVLSCLLPILIAGALGLTRAALLRARDTSNMSADWKSAGDGLGLYSKGLRARIAVIILAAALPPLLSELGVGRAVGKQVQEFVLLAGPVLSGMMLAGLLRYACLPGLEGTRGYVYASLTLFMLAELVVWWMHKPWAVGVVLPATFLLLTGSFHRLAQALNDPDATQTARQVAFLLFVPGSVTSVFRFFAPEHTVTSLLSLAAAVCVLVGVVRFFLLLGLLRQRMTEAAAPPSSVSIFPSV